MRRAAVKDPARRGHDAVGALLLDGRKPAEKLVGDILAKADTPERRSGQAEPLGTQDRRPVGTLAAVFPGQVEDRDIDIVDLAEVVADACDFEPVAVRIDHPPPGEIVERRAPEDRLFAACVDRDIAADAGRVRRRRVDGEHEAGGFGGIGDAPCHDAGAGRDRHDRGPEPGQVSGNHGPERLQLLGVDDGAHGRERHGASRVAGPTTARDDRQAEFNAGAHKPGYLRLAVRMKDHERIGDAPVGCIGDVRYPGKRVETDVVGPCMAPEHALRPAP